MAVADAHRGERKRLVVRADEKLHRVFGTRRQIWGFHGFRQVPFRSTSDSKSFARIAECS